MLTFPVRRSQTIILHKCYNILCVNIKFSKRHMKFYFSQNIFIIFQNHTVFIILNFFSIWYKQNIQAVRIDCNINQGPSTKKILFTVI